MMNKAVFDTSFLSSFYNKEDALHLRAVEDMDALPEKSMLIIPAVTVLELTNLFNRSGWKLKSSMNHVYSFIDKVIYINQEFLDEFVDFVQKTDLTLKPNDYAILFTAIKYKAKLLTFDRQLYKAYAQIQGEELFSE